MNNRSVAVSQGTFLHLETPRFLDLAAQAGFEAVNLWHGHAGPPAAITAQHLRDCGLAVVAVSRVGDFTDPARTIPALERDRQVIEDAVTLGASVVVVVTGPVLTDFADAESQIHRGLEALLPIAADAGVRLAIEVFHPMFVAERSAIVTMRQANELLGRYPTDQLGIALDSYHVWWDPQLRQELDRAQGRILIAQVADWLVPTLHLLRGRGLPGDGVIPLRSFIDLARATGYDGPIEVEVLNDALSEVPPGELAHRLYNRTVNLEIGIAP